MGVRSLLRTNLCNRGSAEITGGWSWWSGGSGGGTAARVEITNSPLFKGKYAWRVTYTISQSIDGHLGGIYFDASTVTAGKTYSLVFYAKVNRVQVVHPIIEWVTADSSSIVGTSAAAPTTSIADKWTTYKIENVVVPTNGAILRVTFYSASSANGGTKWLAGDTIEMTGVTVVESSTSGEPFYGSSMETRDRFYKWAGMVGDSNSQEYSIVPDEWSPMGSTLSNLKQKMIETILGPTPVRTGTESVQDIKKAALEKLLGDNGLI